MDGGVAGRNQVRRGRRRFLLLLLAVIGVGALAGGFLAGTANVLDMNSSFMEGDPPGWASVLGAVLAVLGAVVLIGGFVHLVRSGRYRRSARSPLWGQSWSRRRDLVRQVKGRAPVRDEDVALLRQVARQLADQRAYLVPFTGMVLLHLGQVFLQWAPFWVALGVILGLVFVIAVVAVRRDERQAYAFLREYPAV